MWVLLWNTAAILTTVTVFVISALLLYYQYAFRYWKTLGVPHPKPKFPFGNLELQMSLYIGQSMETIYRQMKDVGAEFCGYFLGSKPIFMPISPDMIKHVLTKDFASFHYRGFHLDEKRDPLGASVAMTQGDPWKMIRSNLTRVFTSSKTKSVYPAVVQCCDYLDHVLNKAAKSSEAIDIYEVSARYGTDVVCVCAFGVDSNTMQNPDADFRKYGRLVISQDFFENWRFGFGSVAPFFHKMFNINLWNPSATSFLREIVKEIVDYRTASNTVREDIIQSLMQLKEYNGKSLFNAETNMEGLTIDQITAECFLLFIAGFETAANVIKFCAYELALNPEIQDKLRQEIRSVLHKHNGEVSYEATLEMQYLDNIVHETMRKYPPIHMLNRVCTADFKIPDTNITIQKGTTTTVSLLGLHLDPEFYPDPQKFDPDRFTKEERAKRHPYMYLPFGDGPRACFSTKFGILEVEAFMIKMIKDYKFTIHPDMKLPMKFCSIGNMLHIRDPILLLAEKI